MVTFSYLGSKISQAATPATLEGESDSFVEEAGKFFENPEDWMTAENARLGGKSPSEAIADGQGEQVRMILRQARFIGVS